MSVASTPLDILCAATPDSNRAEHFAIVAAHQDDEVIGAGARLPLLPGVVIIHATDGAPRDTADARRAGCDSARQYAALRAAERARALTWAGVAPSQVVDVGIPDQETTERLIDLTMALERVFSARGVRAVLTHPYEGGHPDHDATAFAVHHACSRLARRGHAMSILEFTSYHMDHAGFRVGCFPADGGGPGVLLELSHAQRALKRAMFACYASQAAVLAQFGTGTERFRIAPAYDFTLPPTAAPGGRLYYESQSWAGGMCGARFRSLATLAAAELACVGAAA
jgi:LmbE family N-acetylglucosaminyl deacetylase